MVELSKVLTLKILKIQNISQDVLNYTSIYYINICLSLVHVFRDIKNRIMVEVNKHMYVLLFQQEATSDNI